MLESRPEESAVFFRLAARESRASNSSASRRAATSPCAAFSASSSCGKGILSQLTGASSCAQGSWAMHAAPRTVVLSTFSHTAAQEEEGSRENEMAKQEGRSNNEMAKVEGRSNNERVKQKGRSGWTREELTREQQYATGVVKRLLTASLVAVFWCSPLTTSSWRARARSASSSPATYTARSCEVLW